MTKDSPLKLTTSRALALPVPATAYRLVWCPQTPGFGVRVTASGSRAWILERRDTTGKTVRRTLGSITGRSAITDKVARELALEVSAEIAKGVDRLETRRAAQAERQRTHTEDRLTVAAALVEYVTKKRRTKDGKPLKESTQADYLRMIEPERLGKRASRGIKAGELHPIASKPLAQLTAEDIRSMHTAAAKRGQRRATYAAQVLRAVLNWHGVAIAGNPLSKDVAGRDRIILKPTAGDPRPIPPERLAAWWDASCTVPNRDCADMLRLMLLTGLRPGEVAALTVADVDHIGARLRLADTKNRKPHTVYLSSQAQALLAPYLVRKAPGAHVFDTRDTRRTLAAINAAAGVRITPHDLRKTFASVAEELVSAYALKAMLNHAHAADVTGAHYVAKSETQLRAAWQTVADTVAGAKA